MKYRIKGLDCPSCAAKIERSLRQIDGLQHVTVDLATESVELPEGMLDEARRVARSVEPEAQILDAGGHQSDNEEAGEEDKLQVPFMVAAAALLLLGAAVIRRAVLKLARGEVFDENMLMTIATLGAVAIHQLPLYRGIVGHTAGIRQPQGERQDKARKAGRSGAG